MPIDRDTLIRNLGEVGVQKGSGLVRVHGDDTTDAFASPLIRVSGDPLAASPLARMYGMNSVLGQATAYWDARFYSGVGPLLDRMQNGHTAQLGSVAEAVIATDYDKSNALVLPGVAGNYGSIEEEFQRASDAIYSDGTNLQTATRGLNGQRNAHKVTANDSVEYTTDLLTGALTNLMTQDDISLWDTVTATVTGGQPDPKGGTDAYTVEDDDGAAAESAYDVPTFTGDGVKSVVFVVKENTTPAAGGHRLRVQDASVGPTDRMVASITSWTAGDPQITTSVGTLLSKTQIGTTGWWILSFQTTAITAANSNRVYIYPAFSPVTDTAKIDVYRVNAYDSAVPLPMPYDASFAKAADSLLKPYVDSSGDAIAPQEMTVYCKFVEQGSVDTTSGLPRVIQIGSGAAASLRIEANNSGVYRALHDPGVSSVSTLAAGPSIGDLVELRAVLNADGSIQIHQSINGAAETTASAGSAQALLSSWSTADFWINESAGSSIGFNAHVQHSVLSGTATLAQCQAATRTDSDVLFWYEPGDDVFNVSVTDQDFDLQRFVAATDWTPAANYTICSKGVASGNQRSWRFLLLSAAAKLYFDFSPDGSSLSETATSSAAPTVSDGDGLWVRITRSGTEVKFYTGGAASTPVWVQLGTTQTVGSGAIFDSTAPVEIGSYNGGTGPFNGRDYAALLYADLTETNKILDQDFTTVAQGDTSFFETAQSGLVTVNQSGADTNDPLWLPHTGDNYLFLPGTAGNLGSTVDHARLDITGDIEIQMFMQVDSTSDAQHLYKWVGSKAYWASTSATTMRAYFSSDGAAQFTSIATASLASVGLSDGDWQWLRWTRESATGVVRFYYGGDGDTPSWTQLGADVAGTAGALFASTAALNFGSISSAAKIRRVRIYDGIAGTLVFDFDPSQSFTVDQANSAVITINRTASAAKSVEVTRPVFLLHTDDYLEIADHPDLDATADYTVVVLARRYGTAANDIIACKYNSGGANPGWRLLSASSWFAGRFHTASGATDDASQTWGSGTLAVLASRRLAADVETFVDDATDGATAGYAETSANAEVVRVGSYSNTGSGFMDFEFFGMAIFQAALSVTDIRRLNTELGL